MITIALLLIQVYVSLYIVSIIHELGHDLMTDGRIGREGKIVAKRWFPLPVLQSNNIDNNWGRYGGLFFNFMTALIVMKLNPQNQFLIIIGCISVTYLMIYLILGGFWPERKGARTIDDIPNQYALTSLIIGIICFIIFKDYYLKAATIIIGG